MRKLILKWLFGIEYVDKYMELLIKNRDLHQECIDLIEEEREVLIAHRKTIDEELDILNDVRKLIKICENHKIDVDKEIKEVKL